MGFLLAHGHATFRAVVAAILSCVLVAKVTTATNIWFIASGECTLTSEGCIRSPNYPSRYDNDQQCEIAVDEGNTVPIEVRDFEVENDYWDYLKVNGVDYTGGSGGPAGIVPEGYIYWVSDYTVTATGWEICPDWPCIEDLQGMGAGYRGCQSTTREGYTCQAWSAQEPHQHDIIPENFPDSDLRSNYCRNPDRRSTIWCFTTNPAVEWQWCDPQTIMWQVTSGECTIDNEGCLLSPTYPNGYMAGADCDIKIFSDLASPIKVEDFDIRNGAYLLVNNFQYRRGNSGPEGVIPSADIVWNTNNRGSNRKGWRLCPVLPPTTITFTATITSSRTSVTTLTTTVSTTTTSTVTATVTTVTGTSTTTVTGTTITTTATTTTVSMTTVTTTTTRTVSATTMTGTSVTATTSTYTTSTQTTETTTTTTSRTITTTTSTTTSSTTRTATTQTVTFTTVTSTSTVSSTTTTPEPILVGGRLELQVDDAADVEEQILTDSNVTSFVQDAIATGIPQVEGEDVNIIGVSSSEARRLSETPRALAGVVFVVWEVYVPADAGVTGDNLSPEDLQEVIGRELAPLNWTVAASFVYDPLTTTTTTKTSTLTTPAPIDCVWADWVDWTICTMPCGGGDRERQRVYAIRDQFNGIPCSGLPIETDVCNTQPCIECPAGWYRQLSQTSQECLACRPGRYNPVAGGNEPGDCLECAPGSVSSAGSEECTKCRPGSAVAPRVVTQTEASRGSLHGQAVVVDDHVELPSGSGVEFQVECSSDGSSSLSVEMIAQDVGGGSFSIYIDGQLRGNWGSGQSASWSWSGFSPGFQVSSSSYSLRLDNNGPSLNLRALRVTGPCGLVSEWFCGKCAPGSYAGTESSTACSLCPAGTYGSDHGLSACVSCSNGTFSIALGALDSSSCSECEPGSFSRKGDGPGIAACDPCPEGSYNNQTGREDCDKCGLGTFNDETGSVNIGSCKPCPFGTFGPDAGLKVCVDCVAGTFLVGTGATNSSECQSCAAGTFTGQGGMSQCVDCLAGEYSEDRSSACTLCELGRFMGAPGSSACEACLEGTYADSEGSKICSECPQGTYGESTGAVSDTACTPCQAGRFSTATAAISPSICQPCGKGEFSRLGSATCETCDKGSYSVGDAGECTVCEAGSFVARTGASVCDLCNPGHYRTLGSPGDTCIACDVGRYNPDSGAVDASSCGPCPGGSFSNQLGARSSDVCEACPGGEYSGSAASVCISCDVGTYSTGFAASCTPCAAGNFQALGGKTECDECPAGKYRPSEAPGFSCLLCPHGTRSNAVAAENVSTCEPCAKGTYGPGEGLTSCTECAGGAYADEVGLSNCKRCDDESDSPAGAHACCPVHDIETWPVSPAGSLYTPPGKSETRLHYLDTCSLDTLDDVPQYVFIGNTDPGTGVSANIATLNGLTPHGLMCLKCGASDAMDCKLTLVSDRDLFEAGNSIQVQASVLVNNRGLPTPSVCNDHATLILAGFGCAPWTLSLFLTTLSVVVVLTLLMGMVLELISRVRIVTFVECSLDIALQGGREKSVLPTAEMLYRSVLSALQVRASKLPRENFHTWLLRDGDDAKGSDMLHVEFAVKARGQEHTSLRRRLLKSIWVPAEGPEGWTHAAIEQQPPSLVKGHSQVPGFELFVLLEQATLILLGGVESEEEAGMKELHLAVAREVLQRLTSRTSMVFLVLQYFINLVAAGALPALGYYLMSTCEEGYPFHIHLLWLAYIGVSSVLSLLLLRCALAGTKAREFCWRCATRLLLRVIFACTMLTDTYQDATFAVIAKKCGFDLWFVSAWLIVLGVGVMQIFAQVVVLSSCVLRYHRATTPEQRQRLLVEGAFLALRGSDNLALTYAVRPAVEEQLGGASSWAMKMSEARIAFFRFIFEDVEQSALQVVFLIFYEDANMVDKVWVSLSIATSLLLSFTLVVQCVPEVRDWLWYRIFARFPGGRLFPQVRVIYICLALALYRALSSFPWISACSPSGDPCDGSFVFWGCNNEKLTLFGLPARMEVVYEVARTSGYCLAGLVTCMMLAGLVWWSRYWSQRRASQRSSAEVYNAESRFAACSEQLRPKVDADDDAWLVPARQVQQAAVAAGGAVATSVPKLVEAIDENVFRLSRGTTSRGRVRNAGRVLDSHLQELRTVVGEAHPTLATSTRQLVEEAEHVQRLTQVRHNVRRLLLSRSFLTAGLLEKSKQIHVATDGAARLRLVHWTVLETFGELPRAEEVGADGAMGARDLLETVAKNLNVNIYKAERHTICFFLSHRWLRTKGPRSAHHPDSQDNVKAKRLAAFARWFMDLAARNGLRCEVAFWIDWCCCNQTNPRMMGLGIAALPLYIAACTKVLSWRTNDFERRCWTMVERLLSYSFCVGGLTPYVIDETFHHVSVEDELLLLTDLPEAEPDDQPPTPLAHPASPVRVHLDGTFTPVAPAHGDPGDPSRALPRTDTGKASPGAGDSAPTDSERTRQVRLPTRGGRSPGGARSSRNSSSANSRNSRSNQPSLVLQRRARKLPNPLDLDTCLLTRAADRCEIAFLVNTALAVPAFEVFADRQPVEWGLTEIIEQSLAVRDRLPTSWTSTDKPPASWLGLRDAPEATEWRLIVRKMGEFHGSSAKDEIGTVVWVDQGLDPATSAPSPEEIDGLFASVDEAYEGNNLGEEETRALISALKADLQFALKAGDQESLEAAILRAREVEMPEKVQAIERVCTMRLTEALIANDEATMRGALRLVQRHGVEHLPGVAQVREKQLQLQKAQLAARLGQLLKICSDESEESKDLDVPTLIAVQRTASKQGLLGITHQALELASAHVQRLKGAQDLDGLMGLKHAAQDGHWSEVVEIVEPAIERTTMARASEAATAKQDLATLRAVEKRAQERGYTDIADIAKVRIRETASRVGDRMGLPSSWDVVLELAGTEGRLLKKAEADRELVDRIQQLVDITFTGWGGHGKRTRTRDRGKEPVAECLKVESVVRVQNAESYVHYRSTRTQIAEKVRRDRDKHPTGDAWDVKTAGVSFAGLGGMKEHPVDKMINEHYLWHGTSPAGAEGITDREFDLKRAGTKFGALFGPGVYLAESCMKSDEYVQADARGWFPVVLCRAILGRVNYCSDRNPHLISSKLEASCKPGGRFDSVLGDREKVVKTFREFIVFDTHQVYPEFIVWYTRVMKPDDG